MALTELQKKVGKALRNSGLPSVDKRQAAVVLAPVLNVRDEDASDFVRLASDNHYPA